MATDEELFNRVVELQTAYIAAHNEFLRAAKDPISQVKNAFAINTSVSAIMVAMGVLHSLKIDDRIQVFPQLLNFSINQKFAERARQLIRTLPHEWVVSNIDAAAKPLLEQADLVEYGMLLCLYEEVDAELAKRLAHEGTLSKDEDIRDIAADFLQRKSHLGFSAP